MRYVGIDPGVTGGFAWIEDAAVEVAKMPQTEEAIAGLIEVVTKAKPIRVMMEKVGGYIQSSGPRCPVCHQQSLRQPGHTMFSFGRITGVVAGCLHGLGIAFTEVEPARWQSIYKLPLKGKKQDERKRVMKQHAQNLYPTVKVTLATADALLLARYNMVKHRGAAESTPLGEPAIHDRDLFEL